MDWTVYWTMNWPKMVSLLDVKTELTKGTWKQYLLLINVPPSTITHKYVILKCWTKNMRAFHVVCCNSVHLYECFKALTFTYFTFTPSSANPRDHILTRHPSGHWALRSHGCNTQAAFRFPWEAPWSYRAGSHGPQQASGSSRTGTRAPSKL